MFVKKWLMAITLCSLCCAVGAGQAMAELKVGVMNPDKVLSMCEAGKKAKVKFEARLKDLQQKFKKEQEQEAALSKEIEKKSSAWSESKRGEKILELKKLRREIQDKTEAVNYELKELEQKELQPILKAMQKAVEGYVKKNGYSIVLNGNPKGSVIYFEESVDISDDIIKEVNKIVK